MNWCWWHKWEPYIDPPYKWPDPRPTVTYGFKCTKCAKVRVLFIKQGTDVPTE